jgi:hypothetical protein
MLLYVPLKPTSTQIRLNIYCIQSSLALLSFI